MSNSPLLCRTSDSLTIQQIERQGQGWIEDSRYRLSPETVAARRFILGKLLWFLRQREYPECGTVELRAFFGYVRNGHTEPGGRWGDPRQTEEVRPSTAQTYFVNLKTFFNFLVEEDVLAVSPMAKLKPPKVGQDQVQPFSDEQVEALLEITRRSRYPKRDEAIVLFLLDTGCRASELCRLRWREVDGDTHFCTVTGKGNKKRAIRLGKRAWRALFNYVRIKGRDLDQPVFLSERESQSTHGITRSGLLQLIERLGQAAGLEKVRCSPHTFRHTFAVSFLRDGGNVYSLQEMLGHTTLRMTRRYVQLAQADIEQQHRQHSPADRLGRRK